MAEGDPRTWTRTPRNRKRTSSAPRKKRKKNRSITSRERVTSPSDRCFSIARCARKSQTLARFV